MKLRQVLLIVVMTIVFGGIIKRNVCAEEPLRVGMEASYAPFNWTQNDPKNGAVLIDGSGEYANGYDVQVAKSIAKKLNRKLVIVKTGWNGLLPALTSNKIDLIIGGMTPSAERLKEINFSKAYYNSDFVIVVNRKGEFADSTKLSDFKGAKITAQQGTIHYKLISQILGVHKETAMNDFSQMRQAVISKIIDGYVAEKPEAMTAQDADRNLKMIEFKKGFGFKANSQEKTVAIGMRKGEADLAQINEYLATFTERQRVDLMNKMIKEQPVEKDDQRETFFTQMLKILEKNGAQFFHGGVMTLLIALVGTIVGLLIGLMIGVFRTKPKSSNKVVTVFDKLITLLLSIYIEIFRGTPMIVQAMVIFYGSAMAFDLKLDRTFAALLIVSVNTGAYMSEIVRGGIFAVDKGQFEASQAIGMTHRQAMFKVILPQVIRNIMPATGNEFVINIKDTSVLNVISVVELYFSGNTIATQNFQYFQTFTIIAAIYFVITFVITRILRFIEKKMDGDANYLPYANQMQLEDAADSHYRIAVQEQENERY